MALNEHEVPRLDITICVDPPNDGKDQGPQSSAPLDWASGCVDIMLKAIVIN